MKALRKTARVLRFPSPAERPKVEPGPGSGAGPGEGPSAGPSPAPGGEKRSRILIISIVGALVLFVGLWIVKAPRGPQPPFLVFENPLLQIRFEYPSSFQGGPNFVKAPSGSMLTIERHSLADAKKDWVAALPDVLFPQVLIQLEENYPYLLETGRTHPTVGGRKGVEVVLRGQLRETAPTMIITILIVANDDWVYVARTYSLERYDLEERPLFRRVRETWTFTADTGGAAQEAAPGGRSSGATSERSQPGGVTDEGGAAGGGGDGTAAPSTPSDETPR